MHSEQTVTTSGSTPQIVAKGLPAPVKEEVVPAAPAQWRAHEDEAVRNVQADLRADYRFDPNHDLAKGYSVEGVGVASAQYMLNVINFNQQPDKYVGLVGDGRFGIRTTSAVADFQKAHDLPETGVLDKITKQALTDEYTRVHDSPNFKEPPMVSQHSAPSRSLDQIPCLAEIARGLMAKGLTSDEIMEMFDRVAAIIERQDATPVQHSTYGFLQALPDDVKTADSDISGMLARGEAPRGTAVLEAKTRGGRVQWVSQFDSSQVEGAGDTACYRACRRMLELNGQHAPSSTDQRIQVAVREDGAGRINAVSEKGLESATSYIDRELGNGQLVIMGVSRKGDYHGNRDGITDHYVVIKAKRVDENGKVYYEANDPGTRFQSRGEDKRYYVDGDGNLVGTTHSDQRAEMSMVVPDAVGRA